MLSLRSPQTLKTGFIGTYNMLGLAKRVRARLLLTSTSEIYGDPEVHPQTEAYWGHVNCIGPRACYDESKRIGETLCYEYHKLGVSVRVARIFNTYGEHMNADDGRVVSNFIKQALQGKPITIYGDGSQTRSFQYVADLVQGLVALMNCDSIDDIKTDVLPINIGNPEEFTVKQFAEYIRSVVNPDVPIVYEPATQDDPKQRKPDIGRAAAVLHWRPKMSVKEGIERTVRYFKHELGYATAADGPRPAIWAPIGDVRDVLPADYCS
jgi:UDP-glucuronate decarboxylase